MKHFVAKPAWAIVLMAAFLMSHAHARTSGSAGAASKAGKSSSQAGQVSQIKFLRGSEETVQERSSRLKRECRGRVNAGACAGYTY